MQTLLLLLIFFSVAHVAMLATNYIWGDTSNADPLDPW